MSVSINLEESDWVFPNLDKKDMFNQYYSNEFISQTRHKEIVKRLIEDHESRLQCSIKFLVFIFGMIGAILYLSILQAL